MDFSQIYRGSNLNLIATTLLILKCSKINFNDFIFEKYCNSGCIIGNCDIVRLKYGNMDMKLLEL